jgi:hypothetical protein
VLRVLDLVDNFILLSSFVIWRVIFLAVERLTLWDAQNEAALSDIVRREVLVSLDFYEHIFTYHK